MRAHPHKNKLGMTGWLETPPLTKPPVYARSPMYWVMLIALVGLMIGTNLVGYLKRDNTPKKGYATEEWTLRSHLLFESLAGKSRTDKELRDALFSLDKSRKTDDLAESYYSIISFEVDGKVPPDSLAHLAKSKSPNLQNLAKIYGPSKLPVSEAQALKALLPKNVFRYRLAAAHALQRAGVKGARNDVVSPATKILVPALLLGVFILVGLGCVLLFVYSVMFANGNIRILGHPAGELSPSEADQFAGKAAQLLTAFLALQLSLSLILPALPKALYAWLNIFLACLIIAATIVLLRRDPISLRRIGWSREKLGVHILWGLGAAIANAPIVLTLALLGNFVFRGLPQAEHPIESVLVGSLGPLQIVTLFILASIQAPIFEESSFRGLIQPALQGVTCRPWLAGLISSILFAAVHPTGIPAWPALAAIGGMSVLLTYQTKSLVPSMIMHGAHNAATLIVSLAVLQS